MSYIKLLSEASGEDFAQHQGKNGHELLPILEGIEVTRAMQVNGLESALSRTISVIKEDPDNTYTFQ